MKPFNKNVVMDDSIRKILNDLLEEGCSLRGLITHITYELKLFKEARSRLSFNDKNMSRFKINDIEYSIFIDRDNLSILSTDDKKSWFYESFKYMSLRQMTNILLLIDKINKGFCHVDDERHFKELLLEYFNCKEGMTFLSADAKNQEVDSFEIIQLIKDCVC